MGDLSDKATGTYDVICANIVANAIKALAPSAAPLLKEGGTFLASGVIDEREGEVAAALEAAGFTLTETKRKNGWVCFVCTR